MKVKNAAHTHKSENVKEKKFQHKIFSSISEKH